MLEKHCIFIIIPLIWAVTAVHSIPVDEDTPKTNGNAASTIAIKVPPAEKDGTPRPMLFIYPDKKNNTDAPKPKEVSTVAIKVPPVEKDGEPRPILFMYPKQPTNKTEAPRDKPTDTVNDIKPKNEDKNDTPKENEDKNDIPKKNDDKNDTPSKKNETHVVAIKVPPVDKDGTLRPMIVIYPVDNATLTTSSTSSSTSTTTTTVAPNTKPTEAEPPRNETKPTEDNSKTKPISWINTDNPTNPDDTVKRPDNFLPGYDCPTRNGFHRYLEKCDVYIMCKDYMPLTYICPDGLEFNPKAKKHEDVCDDPSLVKCNAKEIPKKEPVEGNSTPRPILVIDSVRTERPYPTSGDPSNMLRGYRCPSRRGFYSFPGKCDVYITCEDYTPLTYICPDGLQFNPNAKSSGLVCDDPSVVKCNDGVTRPSEPAPVVIRPPPSGIPWSNVRRFSCPRSDGYFKFTDQCDEYIECRVNVPLRYMCPDGLHFNPNALWTEYPCAHPSVAKCRRDSW